MAKIMMTAEQFQEKQARRLKAAVEDIKAGVERVQDSPTAKAAAKQEKMITNLTKAVTSGKWAGRLRSVSLEDWKAKTIDKGLSRISSGIDGAKDKTIAFANQLLPFQSSLQETVSKMPDLTLEDSIARMTAWTKGMSKFQRK